LTQAVSIVRTVLRLLSLKNDYDKH
jgi:hypothetical protein